MLPPVTASGQQQSGHPGNRNTEQGRSTGERRVIIGLRHRRVDTTRRHHDSRADGTAHPPDGYRAWISDSAPDLAALRETLTAGAA
jgi:hypothetical protein